jgi:hypothetical protein
MTDCSNQYPRANIESGRDILEARLEFRRLLGKYHLLDLIGDSNESIEWFRRVMNQFAGWVGERERARIILQRFREEWDRQREEREMFERAVATGDSPGGEQIKRHNPYIEVRFRRIKI